MFDAQVGAHPRDLRHRARRGGPAAPPDLRPLQSGAGHDQRHPGDRSASPAEADPAKIVQAIRQENVTNSFGSPTLWRKVAGALPRPGPDAAHACGASSAPGRPCPPPSGRRRATFLADGRLHSPYGATEALPVSTVSRRRDRARVASAGACVGRPIAGIEVQDHRDRRRAHRHAGRRPASCRRARSARSSCAGRWSPANTTRLPEATAAAKIADPAAPGGFWHRMGDCGLLDERAASGSAGARPSASRPRPARSTPNPASRSSARIPARARCALIGWADLPAVPRWSSRRAPRARGRARRWPRELRVLGRAPPPHRRDPDVLISGRRFPVDVRHNAKIHRLALARWAASATRLQGRLSHVAA